MVRKLYMAFLVAVVSAMPLAVQAVEATLYLSPNGSDANDGRSVKSSVRSLQRAVDLASKYAGKTVDAVRIQVAEGTYRRQVTVLNKHVSGIDIIVAGSGGARPVFDGQGMDGVWFSLKGEGQEKGRLIFEHLEVRNYLTAIILKGNRDNPNEFLDGNIIRDMVFRNIGQENPKSKILSTSAVALVNARNNIIERSEFLNIRNVKTCVRLHSIYLAHYSSGNRISDNLFDGFCGSPIRLRDSSNNNIAARNRFSNVEYEALFDEWYCNRSISDDCTKKGLECPSWGNVFESNVVTDLDFYKKSSYTKIHVPEIPAACLKEKEGLSRVKMDNSKSTER